jgi:hypothetical protein
MPPPSGISSPTRRFALTSLNVGTGVETTVATSSLLPNGYTSDQAIRATTLTNARSLKAANPSVVYILYGPVNSGYYTNGDRIWDSRVSD